MITDLDGATIAQLQREFAAGTLTPVELTDAYLDRIDRSLVNAVVARNPSARDDARTAADGPLHGIPFLIKDNVAVGGMPTSAGSLALAGSAPPDAHLVTRLRAAGAVILGKVNLSEWANFRSTRSTSGWSAVGGQTVNPHAFDRTPSGSSSGSGAAVAGSLCQVSIGTETDGSIISPSSVCGIVGLKPTLGTVPGRGIVPITRHQDTAGPMSRIVADAAITFSVLAAVDVPALRADSLAGARLGVWRPPAGELTEPFELALTALRDAGAVFSDVALEPSTIERDEIDAMVVEFRAELGAYLATAPGTQVRTIAELVDFNRRSPVELAHFGQEILERALTAVGLDDAGYLRQREAATTGARRMLDGAFAENRLDAIVSVAAAPAWPIDPAIGDQAGYSTYGPAAVAGYPSITVPTAFVGGLPVGILFTGRPGADVRLLDYAFAYEQRTQARRSPAHF